MISRILFLSLITASVGCILIFSSGVSKLLWALCFIAGLVSIFIRIRTFKKLHFQDDILTINSPFGDDHSFHLYEISSWKEQQFYIRGDLKRSLILFVNNKRIILSNYDSKEEFEKICQNLKTNFPDREI